MQSGYGLGAEQSWDSRGTVQSWDSLGTVQSWDSLGPEQSWYGLGTVHSWDGTVLGQWSWDTGLGTVVLGQWSWDTGLGTVVLGQCSWDSGLRTLANEIKAPVFLSRRVRLKANEAAIVSLRMKNYKELSDNKQVCIVPKPNSQSAAVLGRYFSITKSGLCVSVLLNTLDTPITIQRGRKLG